MILLKQKQAWIKEFAISGFKNVKNWLHLFILTLTFEMEPIYYKFHLYLGNIHRFSILRDILSKKLLINAYRTQVLNQIWIDRLGMLVQESFETTQYSTKLYSNNYTGGIKLNSEKIFKNHLFIYISNLFQKMNA